MSKHCDFCMAKIDNDFSATRMDRSYINWTIGEKDDPERPLLVPKTELCRHCTKHVGDAIGKVQNEIFETLDKSRQELLVRAGLDPQTT